VIDAILNKDLVGAARIAGAGLVTIVGTGFLRSAEGMKLHRTKSGELRNRTFAMDVPGIGITRAGPH
jgi:hypothetical protein